MSTLAILSAIALMTGAAPAPSLKPPVGVMGEEAARLNAACRAGKTTSCIHLGIMQRHGVGAPRDSRRALERFVAACEDGYTLACAFTGDMAYVGSGVARNAQNGEILMRRACRRNNEWACETLRRHGLLDPSAKAYY